MERDNIEIYIIKIEHSGDDLNHAELHELINKEYPSPDNVVTSRRLIEPEKRMIDKQFR